MQILNPFSMSLRYDDYNWPSRNTKQARKTSEGWVMQISPNNPVLQALSGAQEVGHSKPPSNSTKTDTIRAVTAPEKSGGTRTTNLRTRHEAEDDDNTRPKPRGSLVDIVA